MNATEGSLRERSWRLVNINEVNGVTTFKWKEYLNIDVYTTYTGCFRTHVMTLTMSGFFISLTILYNKDLCSFNFQYDNILIIQVKHIFIQIILYYSNYIEFCVCLFQTTLSPEYLILLCPDCCTLLFGIIIKVLLLSSQTWVPNDATSDSGHCCGLWEEPNKY